MFSFPQPGQTATDELQWDADADDQFGDDAWIAAARGAESFVEPIVDPRADDIRNPPLVFAAGSSGTFVSDPFDAANQVAGDWVLVTAELAPCELTVTLEPTGEALVVTSLIGVVEEGDIASSMGLEGGVYRVRA